MGTTTGDATVARADGQRRLTEAVDGRSRITLAADLVDWVRRASYVEIGAVAEDLDEMVSTRRRTGQAERFQVAARRLGELCGLLERVGWTKATPAVAVTLDRGEDDSVFARVLEGALELAQVEALVDEQVRELELVAV
jgi:hypothetical protein